MKKSNFALIILMIVMGLLISCIPDDPQPLIISYTVKQVSVYEDSDGEIDVTIEQGSAPYTVLWSNGATTEDIKNIPADMYTLTITDSENQTITETILVEKIQPIFTEIGSVTDVDGNIYKTIKLGNQWWMAQDLKVQHNPQGDPIESFPVNGNVSLGNSIGRLYTYAVTMNGNTTEGSQGIGPAGWHIPTDDDWQELYDFLGGMNTAGIKMKVAGTGIWQEPNDATNASGFSGLPGGGHYPDVNVYEGYPFAVHYWSSTIVGSDYRLHSLMNVNNDAYIVQNSLSFNVAVSIRCVKNQ